MLFETFQPGLRSVEKVDLWNQPKTAFPNGKRKIPTATQPTRNSWSQQNTWPTSTDHEVGNKYKVFLGELFVTVICLSQKKLQIFREEIVLPSKICSFHSCSFFLFVFFCSMTIRVSFTHNGIISSQETYNAVII